MTTVRPTISDEQLLLFHAQLVEQRGFRADQLRMLCLASEAVLA